jgi:hypothetical protein
MDTGGVLGYYYDVVTESRLIGRRQFSYLTGVWFRPHPGAFWGCLFPIFCARPKSPSSQVYFSEIPATLAFSGFHQRKEHSGMIFVKTFKGYEDKIFDLDTAVNQWIQNSQADVIDVKTALGHEVDGRAGSGDLIYTVVYKASAPLA